MYFPLTPPAPACNVFLFLEFGKPLRGCWSLKSLPDLLSLINC